MNVIVNTTFEGTTTAITYPVGSTIADLFDDLNRVHGSGKHPAVYLFIFALLHALFLSLSSISSATPLSHPCPCHLYLYGFAVLFATAPVVVTFIHRNVDRRGCGDATVERGP